MVGNFLGEFPQKPEIVEFPKSGQFHRKFRKFRVESQMERKFTVKKPKIVYFCRLFL